MEDIGACICGKVGRARDDRKPITDASRDAVDVSREESFWEDFGYVTAGPLFVGFTEWLIEQAKVRRLHALYFLAREGLVMQQVYQQLAAAADGAVKETYYLYGSRRALNVAAIKDINEGCRPVSVGRDIAAYSGAIRRARWCRLAQASRSFPSGRI